MAKRESVPEVLTVAQAAKLLQVPASTIYRLAQQGRIPAMKVGKHWRFNRQALLAWTLWPEAGRGSESE